MKTNKTSTKKHAINIALATALIGSATSQMSMAAGFTEAMTSGKASVNFNLRYESVDQENALEDASALTLRTLLAYDTGSYKGFSAKIEMEDTRIVLGQGDYTVGPSGYNLGQYSVIADPEHTELDQGYIQYKNDNFTAKLGRQVITMDGHRFVGHVGWRQDRQTFDALSAKYTPLKNLSLQYAYITQRNRIFAQDADLDAKDHLVNAAYKTEYGTLTGYGYLLEVDNNTENALDTFGVSFAGSTKTSDIKVLYRAEYASQSSESAVADYDVDYFNLEVGAVVSGITTKVGYEVLGSDSGAFGFATPLATLHKFNGWSDQFLGTPAEGLVDTNVSLAGKALGGGWKVVYHKFDADNASATVDDLGSELNLSYVKKYAKHYTAGIKYAAYSAGDIKVDADKIWVWIGAKF
ncbi:alginate export family protein [uncultured Paraglaciecola sp.]|uniref:alginate export family protein n=1 Tax=uncultured Paraglaciecola sp. TaxID=1765024 RepID=UPI0025F737FE|nr:alginate export family protein [uncultured Paraglaciecola sp.]